MLWSEEFLKVGAERQFYYKYEYFIGLKEFVLVVTL
jgi:hypothetical protein